MNDTRPASAVNRVARGTLWREESSPRAGARAFLFPRVISLWARLQQSFRGRTVRQLRVRETLALGEKRQLLIVECGERQLLIGAAGNFLAMLAELPVAEPTKGEAPRE